MEESGEVGKAVELAEGAAEDGVAAAVPADAAGAVEVEGPAGAFAAVEGFDEGVGAVLQLAVREFEALGEDAAAVRHEADDESSADEDDEAEELAVD